MTHPGRHMWFADWHHPGPLTVLRCRKCAVLFDDYKARRDAKKGTAPSSEKDRGSAP